jgi:hypothetical protein
LQLLSRFFQVVFSGVRVQFSSIREVGVTPRTLELVFHLIS